MTASLANLRPRQWPATSGRALSSPPPPRLQGRIEAAKQLIAEPFTGITTDGTIVPDLFPIRASGVPTHPIRDAAEAVLASLDSEQQARARFPIESDAWRRWSNIHPFMMRHGVCLDDLTPAQREQALALLQSSLSQGGFETARDVMKLNHTIGEITDRWDDYGEWLYWLSLMGTPAPDEPWGWQLDGHHLNLNAFVLGDQLVMTPMFMGSEPVVAPLGKYAGTRVFEVEEREGLAFMRSLDPEQRRAATIGADLPGDVFATAFRDNLELGYAGIPYDRLSPGQRDRLLHLIGTYVGRVRPGHAEVKLAEVKQHLADTHFAWIGDCEEDSVFYYRVHSPVILIEFDHQRGVALDNDQPSRNHIHTVVRTPNGNDYGKDLLRQHYRRFDHAHESRSEKKP
jgi:hypothetical protein